MPPAEANGDGHQDIDLQVDPRANLEEGDATDLALGMSMQSMRSSLRESVEEHNRTHHSSVEARQILPAKRQSRPRPTRPAASTIG